VATSAVPDRLSGSVRLISFMRGSVGAAVRRVLERTIQTKLPYLPGGGIPPAHPRSGPTPRHPGRIGDSDAPARVPSPGRREHSTGPDRRERGRGRPGSKGFHVRWRAYAHFCLKTRYALRRLFAWVPALAWVSVLTLLSRLQSIPEPLVPLALLPDKLVHGLLYMVLGVALAMGRELDGRAIPHFVLVAAGSLFGALDELHQGFVPGRTPEVGDWVADTIGVIAGYTFFTLALRRGGSSSRRVERRNDRRG